ncbi:ribosome maturation factor RimP [Alteromonas gracilis]
MSIEQTRERLAALLTEPLEGIGLDLEAVELSNAGKRRVLRIAVDQDGGVSLDEVGEATRLVNDLIESTDVMGQLPYTLEVGSPGIDRPLTQPRHWRRNLTRLVAVTLTDGSKTTGRVVASDDEGVDLDVDGATRRIALADVAKAKVQVEFKRPAGLDDPADTADHDDEED